MSKPKNKSNSNKKVSNAGSKKTSGPVKTPETTKEKVPEPVKEEAPRPRTIAGQIVEVEPKKKEENDSYREDNLEMKTMSFRERRAIRKARREKEMEGMSRMERVSYLLYYFKTPIIFTVGGILIVSLLLISIIMGKRPVILSVACINVPGSVEITEANFDDYAANTNLAYEGSIKLDATVYLDLETANEVYNSNPYDHSLTQFPALCASEFFDIVITDKTGMDYCSYSNIILDPETVISPGTILELRKYQVDAKDADGNSYFFGYDITDTDFARSLHMKKDLYICFPGKGDTNKENAERFLRYVYGLPSLEQ